MNSGKKRMIFLLLLTTLLLLLLTGSAFGVENFSDLDKALAQQQKQPELQSDNLWWNFVKLILVLGLIIGAAWSIIRLFGRQAGKKMQGTWLHIVDEVNIGQNRGIVLCEIGGKIYALGVTDGQINKLFEVDDEVILEEIRQGDHEAAVTEIKAPFNGLLSGLLNKPMNDQKKTRDFHELMQEQVMKMKSISSKSTHQEMEQKRSDRHE